MVAMREQFGGGTTCRHIAGTLACMSATEEQMFPSRITARLAAWLAPLLLSIAAIIGPTVSARTLCVSHNRTGRNPTAAPFGMLPTIASPDWSKNLFVSNDPAHGISKFLGGQAFTTLATAGASELPSVLSSGTEEATSLLPGATTGVTDLAEAKTATTLSEDAVKTPTANTVTAKVPRPTGKATEEELAGFENEGGGQPQGQAVAKKPVPNPHGKLGGPAHRAEVNKVVKDIESRGLRAVREERIGTPGGAKQDRYADVVAKDEQDRVVEIHQVGRQTKGGSPVARERAAIRDIEKATGTKVKFHKYK